MNVNKIFLTFLFFVTLLSACKKDEIPEPGKKQPAAENIEVGTANNETGVIGQDFHFNAKIIAGNKIDLVQVKIQPRPGETYSKPWNLVVEWTEYKGAKNATVHKHFDIPTTAVAGIYDFLIIVLDENGTKLELKKTITIYDPANLP